MTPEKIFFLLYIIGSVSILLLITLYLKIKDHK